MVRRENDRRAALKSRLHVPGTGAPSLLLLACLLCCGGCKAGPVKPGALDVSLLEKNTVLRQCVAGTPGPEFIVTPCPALLNTAAAPDSLTFAGYRTKNNDTLFCLVIECSAASDRLVLLPLQKGETPLSILADDEKRLLMIKTAQACRDAAFAETGNTSLVTLSLSGALAEARLGIPLPPPGRILAAAANFPSHLLHDLALKDPGLADALGKARPRIFQKYPPVQPPGMNTASPVPRGIIGPYDALEYPESIMVPVAGGDKPWQTVKTRLDYEVEIGAVIGRRLTRELVNATDDARLRKAVAGYVLVSDTKARNPQVVQKIKNIDKPFPADSIVYQLGDTNRDNALGPWGVETCRWWSYAAGWGNYAALGPFFVAAPASGAFPGRTVMSARTYGPAGSRPYPPPENHPPDTFFLRQLSVTTEQDTCHDKLIWAVPGLIRSVLAPDSVLPVDALNPGDILCLGTPGGTVITSTAPELVELAEDLLFWKTPLEWHDAFFKNTTPDYLHEGDELCLWADGLGFQRHRIRRWRDSR